jgi:hypothetical protein
MTPYTINHFGESKKYANEQTASKTISSGVGEFYNVKINSQDLLVVHIKWHDGNEEIRCDYGDKKSNPLARLEHGLRMSIKTCSYKNKAYDYCFVRQARIRNTGTSWSNLYSASKLEIDAGAGFKAVQFLTETGVEHLEKAHELLGTTGSHSNDLVALYNLENSIIPVHIYVISRILPIQYNYYNDSQLNIFG